jgi:hypothetical protein
VDIIVAIGYYYRKQPKDELLAKALLKPVIPVANPSKFVHGAQAALPMEVPNAVSTIQSLSPTA